MVVTRSQTKLSQDEFNVHTRWSGEAVPAPQTGEGHAQVLSQLVTTTSARSVASSISRSSVTLAARKSAAEALHVRRVGQLEINQMEAEMRARQVELEREAAEADYKAELAAIEAEGSNHGSQSGWSRASIKQWLDTTAPPAEFPVHKDRIRSNNECEVGASKVFVCSQPSRDVRNVVSHDIAAQSLGPFPQQNFSGADRTAATDIHGDSGDSIGVAQLVGALRALAKNNVPNTNKHFIKLPCFEGSSPLDWLTFKRAFQDTVGGFTEAENLARLNQALKGAAREAVYMLLVLAPRANDVIEALDRRYGSPEQITLQEVSAIKALPKLGSEVRDLHVFTTRVRNCVEVAKLLQHTDYLRSPELFGTLLSKFSPLLRARWLDFADKHEDIGYARVELLSRFLDREVDLATKFGATFESTPVGTAQKQRVHAVSESATGASTSPNSKSKPEKTSDQENINICLFCKGEHQLSKCSTFTSLTVDDRWRFVKDNKICFRCLQKVPHNFRFCNKNKASCTIVDCKRRHHTVLHNDKYYVTSALVQEVKPEPVIATEAKKIDQVLTAVNNSYVENTLRPLLKVLPVTVSGPTGSVDTFALLDDGSTATFVDADIASKIGAEGPVGSLHLDCVGGLSRDTSVQFVDFNMKGRSASQTFSIQQARAIKNLGLQSQGVTRESLCSFPYLSDVMEELCYAEAKPTILLGIDNWPLIIASEVRKGTKTQPVAIRTPLGWVLFGCASSRTALVETSCHLRERPERDLEVLIRDQYRLDAIGITKQEPRSADDQRALRILEQTAQRRLDGHFQVGLLWKADNRPVPDSYPLALSRFKSLELKMSKDLEFAKRYRANFDDMRAKGYVEECSGRPPTSVCWYLPHFGVTNPNKPGKLRVVHDAAAKVQGVSLNSMLLSGPDLLQPLLGILMRFREGKIALTADIKEMFPQVKIQDSDRDAQRLLWRDDTTGPIKIFRMSSMIFGACSSPSTAIYILNRNASEFVAEFPQAVEAITSDTYMDDYIGSIDVPTKDAARLAANIVEVHKRGGFEMRGWVSNEPGALNQLPNELLSDISLANRRRVELGSLPSSATTTRTLGLIWEPSQDIISFNFTFKDTPDHLTKRVILAHVMRIYDPIGILNPIVVRGRILFQILWRKNLDWDERLSQADQVTWLDWFECLKSISELRIPRCYNLCRFSELELHVFCDASELAHAAVAYWRFVLPNGDVKLALIASKARVSPLKPASIPRLELQGALIAARLASRICEAHRFKPNRHVFWCDSMTVLGWLRSDARNYKPFVAHRVGEILEITSIGEWRWVPTELNVADDATRGKANIEPRWLCGPNFLLAPTSEWPSEPKVAAPVALGEEELKPSLRQSKSLHQSQSHVAECINVVNSHQFPLPVVADITHFSSWLRLVRATARTHKFIAAIFKNHRGREFQNFWIRGICLRDTSNHGSQQDVTPPTAPAPLITEDIVQAELHILASSQISAFGEELLALSRGLPISKGRLAKLSPVLRDGVILLEGRTSAVSNNQPMILDGKEPAVRLLIAHFHQKFAHANTETVINELRQQYWVIGLRNAVRAVVSRCQLCRLLKGPTLQPPMGNLPEARLAHHRRAFTYTGVDYFGPVSISIGRRHEKRWVALFTCLVTRAIHIEIVASLSADSAIMCLRRFIARRGTPTEIFSDNGTSFVGANRELRVLYDTAVPEFAAHEKIKWRFIPPSAPFMGGAWERLVRSVKSALRVTLRERAPKEEVLATLLAEAEAVVNTRPLTHVSPDGNYPEALTPNHFLLGDSSGRPFPAENLSDAALIGRSGWRKALRLSDHFWRRWVSEYLPTLAPRRVPGVDVTVRVGDPVLIGDGNLPRGTWPRGVIAALHPGRDGVVRVVDVRTSAGTLRRPLKKIVLL